MTVTTNLSPTTKQVLSAHLVVFDGAWGVVGLRDSCYLMSKRVLLFCP